MRPSAPIVVRSSHWLALGSVAFALLLGCQDPGTSGASGLPTETGSGGSAAAKPTGFATLISLPTLSGRTSEALAVNSAGTVVTGYAWEAGPSGTIRAVRWTQGASGSWTITVLPIAAGRTGAIARGVDDQGNAAGNDFPGPSSRAVLWPHAGGFSMLSCAGEDGVATVNGISADGQAIVGNRTGIQPATSGVWRPGGCAEDLPPLAAGAGSIASAANGDGTIVGGSASLALETEYYPARWTRTAGQWQVEQLDQRLGTALGANADGDLAGYVRVSCSVPDGCTRAMVWYSGGGTGQLPTLGGNDTWARDINAAGEVVGVAASGSGAGFFWSAATGMRQLPTSGGANAISDIRADGTRLVAGIKQRTARAVVWVVRP